QDDGAEHTVTRNRTARTHRVGGAHRPQRRSSVKNRTDAIEQLATGEQAASAPRAEQALVAGCREDPLVRGAGGSWWSVSRTAARDDRDGAVVLENSAPDFAHARPAIPP